MVDSSVDSTSLNQYRNRLLFTVHHAAAATRDSAALLGGSGGGRLAARGLGNSTHLRGSFLLKALELAALGLVLGVNLVTLAVS
ncbi:hypothetical protein KCU90_g160, partial [Aureobasidium melanogenum]